MTQHWMNFKDADNAAANGGDDSEKKDKSKKKEKKKKKEEKKRMIRRTKRERVWNMFMSHRLPRVLPLIGLTRMMNGHQHRFHRHQHASRATKIFCWNGMSVQSGKRTTVQNTSLRLHGKRRTYTIHSGGRSIDVSQLK